MSYVNIGVAILRSEAHLVEHMEGEQEPSPDMEMDDVRFSPNLERLLQDNSWVNDATWVYILRTVQISDFRKSCYFNAMLLSIVLLRSLFEKGPLCSFNFDEQASIIFL